MRQTKRRMELLSFYDHTGIERHLTRMARKGWKVEKMNNYFWTYRRIQPQELQVAVTYFPKASDFDPFPSGEQQTLIDYCEETGWELACTWFQMQVFYSDRENPTPIHTEPELEVNVIHQACKTNFLRSMWILLVLSLIGTGLYMSSLISDTLRILASPTDLLTGTCCLLVFLLCGDELIHYYIWHRRARRAAEQGLFLDTPSTRKFQIAVTAVLLACLFWWIMNLALVGQPVMIWSVLAMTLCFGLLVLLFQVVKTRLKQARASAGANRALSVLSCFVCAFVLVGAIRQVGIFLLSSVHEGVETPLYLSDLMDREDEFFLTTTSWDQSVLFSRLEVRQRPWGQEDGTPQMTYERYTTSVPALSSFCVGQMKRLMVISGHWNGEMVPTDAQPWGAEEAYRMEMHTGSERYDFLLRQGSTVVSVSMSWEPTAEQMALIGEKLLNN